MPAHRPDAGLRLGALAERLARAEDRTLERARTDLRLGPQHAQQLIGRDGSLALLDQVREQLQHLRLNDEWLAGPAQLEARFIELEVPERKDVAHD
jgi:hypothetical protein